jgi:hypothetical protein
MSYNYSISPSEQLVRIRLNGNFTNALHIAGIRALAADVEFRPEFHVVIDARQMEYHPSTADLFSAQTALRAMKKHFHGGITVVVTSKFLPTAELLSILAKAWGMPMDATTDLEWLTDNHKKL